MSNKELSGKSAIVTGSTSGIGLGVARAFDEAGMNVGLLHEVIPVSKLDSPDLKGLI